MEVIVDQKNEYESSIKMVGGELGGVRTRGGMFVPAPMGSFSRVLVCSLELNTLLLD